MTLGNLLAVERLAKVPPPGALAPVWTGPATRAAGASQGQSEGAASASLGIRSWRETPGPPGVLNHMGEEGGGKGHSR